MLCLHGIAGGDPATKSRKMSSSLATATKLDPRATTSWGSGTTGTGSGTRCRCIRAKEQRKLSYLQLRRGVRFGQRFKNTVQACLALQNAVPQSSA